MIEGQGIRCRPILESDIPDVVDLLSRGFPERTRAFWSAGLKRLNDRSAPDGYPKLGQALFVGGRIVGVVLTIYSRHFDGDVSQIRCNVSSWFVEPAYASYGGLLASSAMRRSEVVYVNVSAAPHTQKVIEALGFKKLFDGVFIAVPILSSHAARVRVVPFEDADLAERLSRNERDLMIEHRRLGCRTLLCDTAGEVHPFVFYEGAIWNDRLRCLHLAYSRDVASFVACAGALGRALWRDSAFVSIDADGAIAGLWGRYRNRGNKYYKGAIRPRPGDLAYVENAFLR
jgi:hypothetical protein